MSNPVAMVTLKDGSKVLNSDLISARMKIAVLSHKNYVALFNLVEKCRNVQHQFLKNPLDVSKPWDDSKATLRAWNLIDGQGNVHESIRKIVLNSIEGSGLSMKFVNPIKNNVSKL